MDGARSIASNIAKLPMLLKASACGPTRLCRLKVPGDACSHGCQTHQNLPAWEPHTPEPTSDVQARWPASQHPILPQHF